MRTQLRGFLITVFSFASLSLAFGLIGCSGTQTPRDQLQAPGALLYNGYTKKDVSCYPCHDGDGSGVGVRGPNLQKRIPKITDPEIIKAMEKGPLLMPSFSELLTQEEMQQITDWLREQFPQKEK